MLAFTKMMVQGIDYDQKYASTVKWSTVKLLLAVIIRHTEMKRETTANIILKNEHVKFVVQSDI